MSDIKDILEDAQKHSATDGEKFVVIGEESWQALVKYAEGESSSPPEQFESESSIVSALPPAGQLLGTL